MGIKLKSVRRLIDLTPNTPKHETFLTDLNYVIAKLNPNRKPSKTYKPSSMHCIRNMYYQIIGEEVDLKPVSPNMSGIQETGTARHDALQRYISVMDKHNIDCTFVDVEEYIKAKEIKNVVVIKKKGMETLLHHNELNMNFMCDGIIKYRGEYFILEIKTESLYKWVTRENVAEGHHTQATIYAHSLGINKVMFLYENRDNCDKKTYTFEVTNKMRDDCVQKIKDCDEHVKNKTVPKKPQNIDKKTCNYCMYKTSCKRDGV